MEFKTCKKCGEVKSIDNFSFVDSKKKYRRSDCKECKSAYERQKRWTSGKDYKTRAPYKVIEKQLAEKTLQFKTLRLENIKLVAQLRKYKA